jgi:hypothetical protein
LAVRLSGRVGAMANADLAIDTIDPAYYTFADGDGLRLNQILDEHDFDR